jgi:peroxiredoxin
MDQLPNLGVAQKALKDQGGELIAISVDSVETLKAGRKKYPTLPVLLASDESGEAIKALHITHETMGKTLPAPSTILIDKEGIVRYAHYPSIVSDRPNPLTVVYEIQKLGPLDEKTEEGKN